MQPPKRGRHPERVQQPSGSADPPSNAGNPDPDVGDAAPQNADPAWPEVAEGGRLVAFVPDLMDRSRIRAARPDVQFLISPTELDTLHPADVVLVDLGRPVARSRLAICPARIIGFVAHVDHEVAEQAAREGAQEVLARSAFFRRLRGVVGTAVSPVPDSPAPGDG